MQNLQITNAVQTMSSLEIADLTGKPHNDVLKDIRRILDEVEIGAGQFSHTYLSAQNKELPCFNLPRRECDLIIAGYSAKYRLAIIDRWQALEAKQVLSPMQMVIESAQAIMRMEAEQAQQAIRIEAIEANSKTIEARQAAIIEGFKYFTVLAFANLNNVNIDLKTATRLGKKAAELSRAKGALIDKVRDPRFGQINAYQEEILKSVFCDELQ
jgi:phage regulator Rha-like protein